MFFKLLEKKSNFDTDIDLWFDKVSRGSKSWKRTKILKLINAGDYNKKTLALVQKEINNYTLSGYQELDDFINNITSNKYKNEFKQIEGQDNAINEFFDLLVQAVEF